MRGRGAHFAKVRRRVHEAGAEVILPNTVHQHARGQRMIRPSEVCGQGQAALWFRRTGRDLRLAKRCGDGRGELGQALHRIAATQQPSGVGCGETRGVNLRPGGETPEFPLRFSESRDQGEQRFCLLRAEVFECQLANRTRVVVARQAILRVHDGLPLAIGPQHLDGVIGRHAGAVVPRDVIERGWLRKVHPQPSRPALGGDPREGLAAIHRAVGEVFKMSRLVGQCKTGSRRLGTGRGQRGVVAVSRPRFKLVQRSRTAVGGGSDVHPGGESGDRGKRIRMHIGEWLAEFQLCALGFQFCLEFDELFLFRGQLTCPVVVLRATQSPLAIAQPGEDGLHAVVVALKNRIELVIVTARAADGQPEKALAHSANHFVEFVLPRRAHSLLVAANLPGQIRRAGNQETKRRIGPGDIAGKLVANKLVVW